METLQLRKDFLENVELELRQVRAEIFDLRERTAASQFLLDHLEVRAPEDGIVVGLQVYARGQVVQPGGTLLDLVPVDDELIVEAKVLPFDIDSLALGLNADVIFTAFPSAARRSCKARSPISRPTASKTSAAAKPTTWRGSRSRKIRWRVSARIRSYAPACQPT